jgi:hypothetical protein
MQLTKKDGCLYSSLGGSPTAGAAQPTSGVCVAASSLPACMAPGPTALSMHQVWKTQGSAEQYMLHQHSNGHMIRRALLHSTFGVSTPATLRVCRTGSCVSALLQKSGWQGSCCMSAQQQPGVFRKTVGCSEWESAGHFTVCQHSNDLGSCLRVCWVSPQQSAGQLLHVSPAAIWGSAGQLLQYSSCLHISNLGVLHDS